MNDWDLKANLAFMELKSPSARYCSDWPLCTKTNCWVGDPHLPRAERPKIVIQTPGGWRQTIQLSRDKIAESMEKVRSIDVYWSLNRP